MPPAPTLAALRLNWFDARKQVLARLQEQLVDAAAPADHAPATAAAAAAAAWDGPVRRLRKLREGLVSLVAPAELLLDVYQISALAAAAACNHAELLKCLQQLHNALYPAAAKHEQPPAQASEQPPAQACEQPLADACVRGKAVPLAQRQAEVAAALLLYFACVPRQPIMQELVKLLRAASRAGSLAGGGCLLDSKLYQAAVAGMAAVLGGNWVAFLRACGGAEGRRALPLLVRSVLAPQLERVRLQALHAVGLAYRMLPSAVLLRWLQLRREQQLLALLAVAEQGGSRAAKAALEQCRGAAFVGEGSSTGLPETLQFRAAS